MLLFIYRKGGNISHLIPIYVSTRVWFEFDVAFAGKVYVALFNPINNVWETKVSLPYIGRLIQGHQFEDCKGRDIWNPDSKVANGFASAIIKAHGCALFVLDCFNKTSV